MIVSSAWRSAGLTDRGLKRSDNQDSYFISEDGRLLLVADGMGGANGGALASSLTAVTIAEDWLNSQIDLQDTDDIEPWMRRAITKANRVVCDAASATEDKQNMGTTVVMAVLGDDGCVHVAHVGDSRASQIHGSEVIGLTRDHSVVMEMHFLGQLTLEQCRTSQFRHLITRCLGNGRDLEIDYSRHLLHPGDWLVLASDGLSEVVCESELGQIVCQEPEPTRVCEALLETVLNREAPDNVTILCARLESV